MDQLTIEVDDPGAEDVQVVLARHLARARETTPPEGVFALPVEGLLDPAITFFSARRDGIVVGIGALKELDAKHGELKSMHTLEEERGKGIGRAIVDHLLAEARRRGYTRVSLETGSMDAFVPARALYASVGFEPCGPFGDYPDGPTSAFMTRSLD